MQMNFRTTAGAQGAYRVPVITTQNVGGLAAVTPQTYHDAVAIEAHDANTHPSLGTATHTAVKNGNWSDPTLWSTGTLPGAGAIVNTSTFDVTYDVESDLILNSIHVSGAGILRWDTTKDTRLRVDTIMCHGTLVMGTSATPIPNSATAGKPRAEIVFHRLVDPTTTVRLGLMTMGPTRIHGAKMAGRLFAADLAVDATQIALSDLATSGWRVGDTVIVVGTRYVLPATTDAQYTGPTTFWGPLSSSSLDQQDADQFQFGEDEERTITAISATHITLSSALTYPHAGQSATLQDGQVVTVRPLVINPCRSIRFRSADASDTAGGFGTGADLADHTRRAHTMFMHSDDIDTRYFETKNMGRTSTDPTLTVARMPHRIAGAGSHLTMDYLRASNGGALIAAANNVRGRYAIHVHGTGPHLSRKMAWVIGASAWAPQSAPPMPGWAMTHHDSRAAFEECVIVRSRGAGMVSELGNELGQWINCTVTGCMGDGFPVGWGDRSELYTNHNGSAGVAFECQARQILMQGNIAANSRFAYVYKGQRAHERLRVVRPEDLRLYDPIAHSGETVGLEDEGTYGARQPQIPDWHDNTVIACRNGFIVSHRAALFADKTPMVAKRFHAIECPFPWNVPEYSNTYYFRDCFWSGPLNMIGSSRGANLGNVSWGFTFSNIHLLNYGTAFYDDGGGLNYEGFFIDITTSNVTAFTNTVWRTFANRDTHPARDVMGPWTNNPSVSTEARVRTYASIASATQLPRPYPSPTTYGAAMPGGSPAVAIGGTPYFVLDADSDVTMGPGTFNANFSVSGIIRDCVGDRRWPDWQSSESSLANMSVKGKRTFTNPQSTTVLSGTEFIQRNKCYLDGATWKSRFWFAEADRFTCEPFQFYIDMTLTGFDTAFLQSLQTAVPTPAPPIYVKAEQTPATQASINAAGTPTLVTATALSARTGHAWSQLIQTTNGHDSVSIVGGTHAASFEMSGRTLRFVGGIAPTTAQAYAVTLRIRDAYTAAFADHTLTVTVAAVPYAVGTTVNDTFDRADANLEANGQFSVLTGSAGAMAVRSNYLAAGVVAGTSIYSTNLGSADQRFTGIMRQGATSAGILLRLVDASNFIQVRRQNVNGDTTNHSVWVTNHIAGAQTTVCWFKPPPPTLSMVTVITVEIISDVVRVFYDGVEQTVFFGSATLPGGSPAGTLAGFRSTGTSVNPWLTEAKFEGITVATATAPTILQAAYADAASTATTATLATGATAGNKLLAYIALDKIAGANPPTGFSAVAGVSHTTGSGISHGLFEKTAVGGETAVTWTLASGGGTASAIALLEIEDAGAIQAAAQSVTNASTATRASGTATLPASDTANSLAIAFWSNDSRSLTDAATGFAFSGGFATYNTEGIGLAEGNSTAPALAVGTLAVPTAGTVAATEATYSGDTAGDENILGLLLIRPAP